MLDLREVWQSLLKLYGYYYEVLLKFFGGCADNFFKNVPTIKLNYLPDKSKFER